MRCCKVCRVGKELEEYYFFKDKGFATTCKKCYSKLQVIKNKSRQKRLHILDAFKTNGNGLNSTNNEKDESIYVFESKSQNRRV